MSIFYGSSKKAGGFFPAGTLIITVPAYSWLYGAHDKMLHHFRKYSKNTLNEIINYRVFSIETVLVNKTNLPFGASIVAVCRKT